MKSYSLKLDSYDYREPFLFSIEVQEDVTKEDVIDAIGKEMEKNTDDDVRPTDLMDNVCEEHGWAWEDFSFDIEIEDVYELGDEKKSEMEGVR